MDKFKFKEETETAIINIMGKKGSGKTYASGELAKYLLNEGYSVYMDAFGTELKKIVMLFFGVSKTNFDKAVTGGAELEERIKRLYLYVYKNIGKEYDFKDIDADKNINQEIEKDSEYLYRFIKDKDVRKILQYTGTEIIRKIDPAFFTEALKHKLKKIKDCADYIIISDCRFINEYEMLNKEFKNVKNFYITADEICDNDKHISEIEINKINDIYGNEIINIKNDKSKILDVGMFKLTQQP
ncbi:MAG: hypothetical protein ACP5NA_05425 [Candidatus Acidulodesulfobacterium sp.]